MANNFLQFSEQLEGLTEDEAAWLELMATLASDRDVAFKGGDDRRHFSDEGEALTEEAKLAELLFPDEPPINCEVTLERGSETSWTAWFYSDECNDPFAVGTLVQAFFQKFRPGMKQVFSLTWADWCDKLRCGAFSGGALVATEHEIDIRTAHELVSELEAKLAAGEPGGHSFAAKGA